MVHLMRWASLSHRSVSGHESYNYNKDQDANSSQEHPTTLLTTPRLNTSAEDTSKVSILREYNVSNNHRGAETTLLKKIARRIHSQLPHRSVSRSSFDVDDQGVGPGSYEFDKDTISMKQHKLQKRREQLSLRNPYLNKVFPAREVESRPPTKIPVSGEESLSKHNVLMNQIKAQHRPAVTGGPSIQSVKQVDEQGRPVSRSQQYSVPQYQTQVPARLNMSQEAKLAQMGKLYSKMRLRDMATQGKVSPFGEYKPAGHPSGYISYFL